MIEVIYSAGHGGAATEGDLMLVDSKHATQAEADAQCARMWAQGFEAYTRAAVQPQFDVHYTRGGKRYFDGIYAATAEQARADFLSFARELGWKVTVEKVEARS